MRHAPSDFRRAKLGTAALGAPPGHPRRRPAERGIGLHAIEQGIDTSTIEGRAMFGMLSALAEPQRELIVAITVTGAEQRPSLSAQRPPTTGDALMAGGL